MDEWLKKKKAASNGGLGMSKFVDYSEQKRLSRLKNIRGSINQSMQHNTWQASQLEKRRKEQIRQRKREAKRRAEKKGFQVDTGCATPYEFTKCGLKLRLEKSSNTTAPEKSRTKTKRETNNADEPERKQLPLVSQYTIDRIELHRRKPVPAQKNVNVTKRKEDVKVSKPFGGGLKVGPCPDAGRTMDSKKKEANIKPNATQRQYKDSNTSVNLARDNSRSSDSSSSRCSSSSSEGKENGDNSNRSKESDGVEAKQTLPKGKLSVQKKKPAKKSTDSYFMDFASLKREHADAIEMLKQLDEENKLLFVKKDGGGLDFDAEWTKGQKEKAEDVNDDAGEESLAVMLPEGMLHATHLSISLHEIEDDDLHDREVDANAKLGDKLADGLDDESDSENSYSNSSLSKQEGDDEDEQDFEDSEEGVDTDVEE
mmetsp:Transcript_5098/g.7773  ORF Transcript_5098/g.7773 Transcript_5098/m.7773 type:complete len:427 (+) Transcript_5098:237-1517(+)|eukprot:CAMPEP_0201713490 /NCGR_PEP_ID=MMETSP0593-20130828/309_1 /ASSEMBLY_ACC=CAM_ASM_000672 /TAXON_ID=267983 /ORGANISM="Skeletonema japonicum, Strain CCMP2506" /LENGTH=426 /DNA_ID=CAMNT_0048202643 /DNA_START=175 /DNA_END=1455 /DNA_ORIENTATION=+